MLLPDHGKHSTKAREVLCRQLLILSIRICETLEITAGKYYIHLIHSAKWNKDEKVDAYIMRGSAI
jgi:hypothetical protein